MAKGIVGIKDLTAEKAKEILVGFDRILSVDKKGRLVVEGDVVKVFLKFTSKNDVTEIKFNGSRWMSVMKVLFIPFYWIYGNIKAAEEHQKLLREVIVALNKSTNNTESSNDISVQLQKLKEMKDSGLITSEEFKTKKADLLSKM